VLLALCGELVDDLPATPGQRGGAGDDLGVALVLGDPAGVAHPAQRRVERAVGERAEGAERGLEALTQLVAVQRGLVQQAEDGEL